MSFAMTMFNRASVIVPSSFQFLAKSSFHILLKRNPFPDNLLASHRNSEISRIFMTSHQTSLMSSHNQQQSTYDHPIKTATLSKPETKFFVLWPEKKSKPFLLYTHLRTDGSRRDPYLLSVLHLMRALPGMTDESVWEHVMFPDVKSQEPLPYDTELDSLAIGRNRNAPLVIRRSSDQSQELPLLLRQKSRKFSSQPSIEQDFTLEKLVDTSGADFVYSDRENSFKVLADCLLKRYMAWKKRKTDRNLHPIPFLADGPGSGKSRFLQELPTSFIDFILREPYPEEFKSIFQAPLCINISFSNGSLYTAKEAQTIDIENSVCLRILYQFETEYTLFGSFYDRYKSEEFSLSSILQNLDASCIILGIDEVNKVFEEGEVMGPRGQTASNNQKERALLQLLKLVGSLSCKMTSFFVPVLAGTIIRPMHSVVRESTHPPLHIPLPLLSFESSLNIFAKKNTQYPELLRTSAKLRQLISDCGGHCRSLEFLYDGMLEVKSKGASYWNDVADYVRDRITERYDLSDVPLGAAIALSFLSVPVGPRNKYPDDKSLKFEDLEERGLIKLENQIVRVPYLFVASFMIKSETTDFTKFWTRLLIEDDFWWQDWEVFNRNYILFCLSLFAYLGRSTVSLNEFFAGSKMNITDDVHICIPPFSSLDVSKISYRYPTTRKPNVAPFEIGEHVLNGSGAPFDSFLYLETTTGDRLLVAFQTKLAYSDSRTPQVIDDKTVKREFKKIKKAINKNLAGTAFVFVILGRCNGTYSDTKLPSNCVVVSRKEHSHFYGKSYCHWLNSL